MLDLIPPLMAATREHALAIGSADRHEVRHLSEAKDAAQHALQAPVTGLEDLLQVPRGLRAVALGAAVDLGGVDPDQPDVAALLAGQNLDPDGVAVDDLVRAEHLTPR